MPAVLRVNGFRFFFFSNEGVEPAHIHVKRAECYAKFWLDPVALERSIGFRDSELNEVHRLVVEHKSFLQERWNEFFRHQN